MSGALAVAAWFAIFSLSTIGTELRRIRKAMERQRPEACDDELAVGPVGGPLWCARPHGHRGPHSPERVPTPNSVTWRKS